MTIMYTTGWVLLAIAFAISFYNVAEMIESKSKIYIVPILVVVSVLLILTAQNKPRLDKYYQVENPSVYAELYPEAYKEGYIDAILQASLIEVNDYGYTIDFNGEEHFYAYEEVKK